MCETAHHKYASQEGNRRRRRHATLNLHSVRHRVLEKQ